MTTDTLQQQHFHPSLSPPRIQEMAEYNPTLRHNPNTLPFSLPFGYSLQFSSHEYPSSLLNWSDNVLQYLQDTDTLCVYFKRTDPFFIASTGLNVFAAKDKAGKICYLEFRHADNTLIPHTFDTAFTMNNQLPLQLSHCYDSIFDFFYIDLISQAHVMKLDTVNLHDPTMTIIFDVEVSTK